MSQDGELALLKQLADLTSELTKLREQQERHHRQLIEALTTRRVLGGRL